jgi:hypothetical protein
LVLTYVGPSWAQGGNTFRSPFNAAQCERAVAFAQQRLRREPASARARLILAEGHLCRGLDDDPWALEEAIGQLGEILADDPANFAAQLDLAEALRRRFPLSEETEQALLRAQYLLRTSDVGAAHPTLLQHLVETTAAVADRRARTMSSLAVAQAEFDPNSSTAGDLSLLVSLLAQTGPHGLQRADEILTAYLARRPDDIRAQFYRAEVQRGRIQPVLLRPVYAVAAVSLCDVRAGLTTRAECSVAQLRLAQIANPSVSDEAGLALGPAERRKEPW